jgi:hypothetical protein
MLQFNMKPLLRAFFARTWIHMAIKLGHGRRFAVARLQR